MKKFLFLICLVLFIYTGITPAYGAENEQQISVILDGEEIVFDASPVIRNNKVMVPYRSIAESLKAEVSWNKKTKEIVTRKGNKTIKLEVNNKNAHLNNKVYTLHTAPAIIKDRTFIPVRFISEALDCNVEWIDESNTVKLESTPEKLEFTGYYALGSEKYSSWTDLFGKTYPETSPGNTDIVDTLALGWYSLDKNGNLITKSRTGWQRPQGWEHVLEAAQKYDLKTHMTIHITDKNDQLYDLLTSQEKVDRAIKDIVTEARKYDGVNLDFEGLGHNMEGKRLQKVKESFNKFTEDLYQKLKNENLELSLSLHPLNSSYNGYDYATLGRFSDSVIIMAYDYRPGTEPEKLVSQAVKLAKEQVAPPKIHLGISAESETPQSIQGKIDIAKKNNLAGIALWRLGIISDEMWESIKKDTGIK